MPLYLYNSSSNSAPVQAHAETHAPNGTDPIPWTEVHAIGSLASRPEPSLDNAGYLYFATDVNGGTAYLSNGTDWIQYTAGLVLNIPATGVIAGTYTNPTLSIAADGRILTAESIVELRELLIVSVSSQSTFQLSKVSAQPDLSRLFLNGVKAFYGLEYVINSSVLTWTGIDLEISDDLEITYI